MGLSPTHILILAVIAVLLFGGGRFSTIMADVAKGVKGFKKSMAEDDGGNAAHPIAGPRIMAGGPAEGERDAHPLPVDQSTT